MAFLPRAFALCVAALAAAPSPAACSPPGGDVFGPGTLPAVAPRQVGRRQVNTTAPLPPPTPAATLPAARPAASADAAATTGTAAAAAAAPPPATLEATPAAPAREAVTQAAKTTTTTTTLGAPTEPDYSDEVYTLCAIIIALCLVVITWVYISLQKQVPFDKLNHAFNLTYHDEWQSGPPPQVELVTAEAHKLQGQVQKHPREDMVREAGAVGLVDTALALKELRRLVDDPGRVELIYSSIPINAAVNDDIPSRGIEGCNRYRNILPNPETRVSLTPRAGTGTHAYMNANYVFGRRFIATQGPTPSSIPDFWHMVWEKEVGVVVMLTNFVENNWLKCEEYFPLNASAAPEMHGGYTITNLRTEKENEFQMCKLQITDIETQVTREVQHYWYTGWPDHGVPDEGSGKIDQFVDFMDHVRRAGTETPIVVHCSAGVGRTGCFMAIWAGLRQIEAMAVRGLQMKVDPARLLAQIRKDRGHSVQTAEQFGFIIRTLAHLMYLIGEFGLEHKLKRADAPDLEPMSFGDDDDLAPPASPMDNLKLPTLQEQFALPS